jgi:hypothetical protein
VEFTLADPLENAGDHHGEREYIVCYGKRRTYREMSVPEPESQDALWSESRRAQGGNLPTDEITPTGTPTAAV